MLLSWPSKNKGLHHEVPYFVSFLRYKIRIGKMIEGSVVIRYASSIESLIIVNTAITIGKIILNPIASSFHLKIRDSILLSLSFNFYINKHLP